MPDHRTCALYRTHLTGTIPDKVAAGAALDDELRMHALRYGLLHLQHHLVHVILRPIVEESMPVPVLLLGLGWLYIRLFSCDISLSVPRSEMVTSQVI